MSDSRGLAPIGAGAVHVICDMQRLFAEDTAWRVAGIQDIVPSIAALIRAHPSQAIFTRFAPPANALAARGNWQRYFNHWPSVTLDRMDVALLDIMAPLAELAVGAEVCEKTTYSAFTSEAFRAALARREADTLIFSGVETDVCVLASVLSAVDCGYRVLVALDAVTSSSPGGHRATMEAVLPRFDQQIEVGTTDQLLAAWAA